MKAWATVVIVLFITGCHRREAPAPAPPVARYTVGAPWIGADGAWYYPKEAFDYIATGLAVVETSHLQRLTADNEIYRSDLPAAAHQTLQLPAIIRLTNLENGRQMLIRVNDRGPAKQGRLLAVTPAAARLLQMQPDVATRVRVEVESDLSRRLAGQLDGGPRLDLQAAPVEAVQEQSLPARGAAVTAASNSLPPDTDHASSRDDAPVPDPLPTAVQQGQANPGELWLDDGQFNQRRYADQVAAEVDGVVQSKGRGRQTLYIVRQGPFRLTAEADAALDHARRAGVTGARIIVE